MAAPEVTRKGETGVNVSQRRSSFWVGAAGTCNRFGHRCGSSPRRWGSRTVVDRTLDGPLHVDWGAFDRGHSGRRSRTSPCLQGDRLDRSRSFHFGCTRRADGAQRERPMTAVHRAHGMTPCSHSTATSPHWIVDQVQRCCRCSTRTRRSRRPLHLAEWRRWRFGLLSAGLIAAVR